MGKGSNKVLKLGNKCIFCGDPADSREHISPQWLQDWVEKQQDVNHTQGITRFDASDGSFDLGPTQTEIHSGPTMTRRLPVVCAERCNGGWMSRLEKAVNPWLGPMTHGQATTLDAERCRLLALWAEKTAMVWEVTDTASVTATQADRDYLREKQQPTPFTEVWIGQSNDPVEWVGRVRHFDGMITLFDELGPSGLALPQQVRVRWDVIPVGQVFLLVSGATNPAGRIDAPGLGSRLTQIWPVGDDVEFPTGKHLFTGQDLLDLSDYPGHLGAQSADFIKSLNAN